MYRKVEYNPWWKHSLLFFAALATYFVMRIGGDAEEARAYGNFWQWFFTYAVIVFFFFAFALWNTKHDDD